MEKWARNLNSHSSKADKKMTNEHMKRVSTSNQKHIERPRHTYNGGSHQKDRQ